MPTIRCPHCGAERNTPSTRLPTKKSNARCPECQLSFTFDPAEIQRLKSADKTAACPHCGLQRPLPIGRPEVQSKTAACRRCHRSFSLQAEPASKAASHGLRSIGQLLTDSWELFCRRGWGLLAIYLLGTLLVATPIIVTTLLKPDIWLNLQNQNLRWPLLLITCSYALLGLSWMTGSMFIYLCKTDYGLLKSMLAGLRRLGSFTLLLILLILLVGGGSLLLLIPGILFCIWFFFCQYILADDDVGSLQALQKSRQLATGHWWAIFGRFLLLLAISLAFSFLTARIPYIGEAANFAFTLLLTPFSLLYFYLIYSDLKAGDNGAQYPQAKSQWLPLTTGLLGWLLIPGLLLVYQSQQNQLSAQLFPSKNEALQMPDTSPQSSRLNLPIAESAHNLSLADYKRLLGKEKIISTGQELSLGPATLAADRFWADEHEPHLWLKLEMSDFPNLNLAQNGAARIEIDKVLDDSAHNRYDRLHSFEHPAFHWIGINRNDEEIFAGIRNVYLQSGTQPEQVHSIQGKLELFLPLAIEKLQLTRRDLGKTLQVAGKQLILQQLSNNEISLHFLGDRAELLNVSASNTNAEPLRKVGFTWQQSGDAFNLMQMFDGDIDSITILVAGDTMVQSYPFELTR